MIIHLYKSHFTINDNETCLHHSLLPLIKYSQITVNDHRYGTTVYWQNSLDITQIDNLDAQEKLLIEPIDLSPHKSVFHSRLVANYNQNKYKIFKQKLPVKIDLGFLLPKSRPFYPRFALVNFVEDWKRKQKQASDEPLVGLGDKNKIKLNKTPTGFQPRKLLLYNVNKRIIRTLRYEQTLNKVKFYHILNIYECNSKDFEAILRWGDVEGTSNNGGTLHFPIGSGKSAVDLFLAHFKSLYALDHNFIIDSASEIAKKPPS